MSNHHDVRRASGSSEAVYFAVCCLLSAFAEGQSRTGPQGFKRAAEESAFVASYAA